MFKRIDSSMLRRAMMTCLGMCLLILSGVSFASAQGLVHADGRINQVHHFGGDALYCVDGDFNPTTQYSDFGTGGFRLLNIDGQELMFIPALQISAAVAEAKETGKGVLVGEGMGSYGPVRIFTYVTGNGDDYFLFSGYDEFGKPNSVEFKFCIPVGPIPADPAAEELCTLVIITWNNNGDNGFAKLIEPVYGIPTETTKQIPCDECPEILTRKLLARKQPNAVLGGGGYEFCLEDGIIAL